MNAPGVAVLEAGAPAIACVGCEAQAGHTSEELMDEEVVLNREAADPANCP